MREGCIRTLAAETQSMSMLMFDVDGSGIDADVDVLVAGYSYAAFDVVERGAGTVYTFGSSTISNLHIDTFTTFS